MMVDCFWDLVQSYTVAYSYKQKDNKNILIHTPDNRPYQKKDRT